MDFNSVCVQLADYRAAACRLQAINLAQEAKIKGLQAEVSTLLIFIKCAFLCLPQSRYLQ